jgi:2-amino-4-hydroxy-6-hydroxymethyldihydropteridine diphosphokinase
MFKEVVSYLSLGSNMGNKLYYLVSAIQEINLIDEIKISKISSFYETEAWGVKEQENFYNMALEIRTTLLPFELLRKLQEIESKLQRVRTLRWGPRTIDIDIIFYGDLNINTKDLIIPHLRHKDRNFVLKPMYEIYKNKSNLLKYMNRDSCDIKKVTPKLLVSSCLLGENCNYKGGNSKVKLLDKLKNSVEYVSVCPEIMGGLSTPRTPAEIKENMVITRTGIEVTEEFTKGAKMTLDKAIETKCLLAIMKKRSPSCGFGKIYDGTFSGKLIDGNGITTILLVEKGIDIIPLES